MRIKKLKFKITVRFILTNIKPKRSLHNKKEVVYCIPTNTAKVYYGETSPLSFVNIVLTYIAASQIIYPEFSHI